MYVAASCSVTSFCPRGRTIGSSNARCQPRADDCTQNYFSLSLGLNETPSRIAIFLMVSGFRPIASTTSSNDFDALASSIKCRCSLNDQVYFKTITKGVLL